jgi:hypothetical protein
MHAERIDKRRSFTSTCGAYVPTLSRKRRRPVATVLALEGDAVSFVALGTSTLYWKLASCTGTTAVLLAQSGLHMVERQSEVNNVDSMTEVWQAIVLLKETTPQTLVWRGKSSTTGTWKYPTCIRDWQEHQVSAT